MNLSPLETGHAQRWTALPVLLAGACLPVIDNFAISMILPTIRGALLADSVQTQFVASVFSGFYAVFLITGSRLGDLYGRKRLFQIGTVGFALASALCALAPNIGMLIVGRAFQGAFGALYAPQVLASIHALFLTRDRGNAIGILGTSFSLAGFVGILGGGLLIFWHPFGLTWQALFVAYLVLGLGVAVGSPFIPESKNPHAQGLDLGGVVLLFFALGSLIFPLAVGRAAGWPSWSLWLLGISPLVWGTFLWYEARYALRGGAPLVSLVLFREPVFIRGLILSFVLYMSYGFMYSFALYLKTTRQMSALDLGLANLPFVAAFFLVSFAVVPLTARLKSKVLILGFGLFAAGFLGMMVSLVTGGGGIDLWGQGGLFTVGMGNGLVLPSLIRVVAGEMEPRHAGLASGVLMSVQQIGSSLGVVLIVGGIYFGISGTGDAGVAFTWVLAVCVGLTAVGAALATTLHCRTKLS